MFKQQLDRLIRSRPKAVSELFSRYGYNVKKPTAQLVVDACIVKKEPFQKDLANVLSEGDSYDGSKLQDFIRKGIAALTGVDAIGVSVDEKKQSEARQKALDEADDKNRILGFNPTLFYALVAVVIITLLLFVFKNK